MTYVVALYPTLLAVISQDNVGYWAGIIVLLLTNVTTLLVTWDKLKGSRVKALEGERDTEKVEKEKALSDLADTKRELVALYGIDAHELLKLAKLERELAALREECAELHRKAVTQDIHRTDPQSH